MRKTQKTTRLGFTLPEVLATVTIIAVLAAVVIPTVAAQIQKADPQKVGRDMLSTRSGVEQFLADVRRYPAAYAHLSAPITGLSGLTGGTYATSEVNRWKGPYLNKDGTAGLSTGYGLTFNANFQIDTLGVTGLSEVTATNPKYLVFTVAIDSVRALTVDEMFDDGILTTGVFRWTVSTAGATDTLKFLVIPIQ